MEVRKIMNYSDENNWMIDFRKEKLKYYKGLEVPNWKRIKFDGFGIPEIKRFSNTTILNKNHNNNLKMEDINEIYNYRDLKNYILSYNDYGFDSKFESLAEACHNNGFLVIASKNIIYENPIKVEHKFNKLNDTLVDYNLIVAEENSEVNIVIDYSSEDEAKAFHTGITKVIARNNARINLIKVQRLNKASESFDINLAYVEENASVNWISIEIGSNITASSYVSNLNGPDSSSNINSVYLGNGERRLDLGYTMNHFGVRSISNIDCRGVLMDSSQKIFRGNLDFKRGAKKASGREQEFVILMDKAVKSHAIPVLFCEEDDVKGEHAASAGQIDGDKLFYLMSRGLSEREAKKLIVEASFNPIVNKIPFRDLRDKIDMEINRRLMDEQA